MMKAPTLPSGSLDIGYDVGDDHEEQSPGSLSSVFVSPISHGTHAPLHPVDMVPKATA